MVNYTITTSSSSNIISLTSPLRTQYIAYNPMDNKLARLLVNESQYLQFVKVLTTSRYNANKLLAQAQSQIQCQEFQDLLRSFSSDTTGDTHTEVLTEAEDEDDVDSGKLITINKDILNHDDEINDTGNLIHHLEFSSGDDEEVLTFEDLQRYEALLNDFESTRDDSNTYNIEETQPEVETKNFLEGLNGDEEDDSIDEANNSFTRYLRRKLTNDETPFFLNNPQEFLRKVSKLWKAVPQKSDNTENVTDLNNGQFHEFFKKWKECHKTQVQNDSDLLEANATGRKLQYVRIRTDPDIEIPEEDITDELIDDKINSLSRREPSSPFEFFYNDQLKMILSDRGNFNLKKKQINSEIMIKWEKVSVLEKARYSSINIDEHRKGVHFASPVKRAVSYHGSVPTSKLSSPKRSISTSEGLPVISNLPELKFDELKQEVTMLTPPISPPESTSGSDSTNIGKNVVNDKVNRLNKKKSWGKDDKWL